MIVVDTSGLLAAIDSSQRTHDAARSALAAERGPLLLSPFVLAELDHLVGARDLRAELALLEDVANGAYRLEPFSADDVAAAAAVVERYREHNVGLADASIVVIAHRAGTRRILTLDERHFRTLRPLGGGMFSLLPADR